SIVKVLWLRRCACGVLGAASIGYCAALGFVRVVLPLRRAAAKVMTQDLINGRANLALAAAAMLFTGACMISKAHASSDLGQGWSQADRDLWYEQTQGSRLLPYSWAKALEVAGGTELFFSPSHMANYGYLPPEPSSLTRMPVGF